jgi:hypothetical protein
MRKINENDFKEYKIIGNGWLFTVHKLADALREWKQMRFGTFQGIKPNGDAVILDTK